MYAIIQTGGKQYRVTEGDVLYIEKLDAEVDTDIELSEVLAVGDEGKLQVGSPFVEKASVSAKVLKHGKAKKITVFTYRPKKNSKRKMGHRQRYTKIEISSIKA